MTQKGLEKYDEWTILGWVALSGFLGYFVWETYIQPVLIELSDGSGAIGAKVSQGWDTFLYWSEVLLILLAVVGGILAVVLPRYYRRRAKREVRYLRIVPHRRTTGSVKKILAFTMDMHRRYRVWYKRLIQGREWFRLIIHGNIQAGEIEFYFGYPQDKESGVKNCFRDHFPNAEWFTVSRPSKNKADNGKTEETLPLPDQEGGVGGYFQINEKGDRAGLPLRPSSPRMLTSILNHFGPGTWLDLRFSPTKTKKTWKFGRFKWVRDPLKKRVQKGLENLGLTEEELLSIFRLETNHPEKKQSDLDPMEKARYQSLFKQHTGREKAFDVALYLWVQAPNDPGDTLSQAIYEDVKSQVETAMEFDNFIYARRLRWHLKRLNPVREINPMPHPLLPRMVWTHSELGNLLQLPKGPTKEQEEQGEQNIYDRITHLVKGQKMPEENEFREGAVIGYVDHPINKQRVIQIGQNIIRKMGSVVGDIGSGKSALLLMLMQSLLEDWCKDNTENEKRDKKRFKVGGFTTFDPKGTLANTLKTRILKAKKDGKNVDLKRVHVIDLESRDFSFGLNLLHRHPWQSLDEVVEDTLTVLKSAYGGGTDSVLLDKYGRIGLRALLLDSKQKHTILALGEFLDKESPLRNRLVKQFKESDDTTKKALAKEIERENYGGRDTEVVRNRLVRLKDNQLARRMFGQQKNSLKVLDWIDNGHIVIFNCQNLPPDVLKITMNYITHQYWQLAQRRRFKQKNHPLIIDEAHYIQLPVFADMIEVLRDFGVPLFMCTQHYNQYEDPMMLAALGLVGTKVAFKQEDQAHARIAGEKAGNSFETQDIQRLKSFQAALYVEDGKGEKRPLLIRTDPPYIYGKDGKPTYFGEETDRIDREKNEAFAWADRELARPLQERDCTKGEEADQEIDRYLESLWEEEEASKWDDADTQKSKPEDEERNEWE
ncbi:hypothetical protein GCM10011571_17260 [Marinithermofilum abyssi]|uniref:Uncharacterized protein n=1 Tax=Marinithermofilum abyssi TaxID=1571185 RepID=A0A8J2YDC4_9BACL|nr:ATP-binding protein [Marinithermofilum abyssi]GGE16165.1 hypothetical protein GCM10011571_17260 [Marinithermofilum abyssi]